MITPVGKASAYTSKRMPVKLVFVEEFNSWYEAIVAEVKIKKWTHRKKEVLVNHGWKAMQSFAKKWCKAG